MERNNHRHGAGRGKKTSHMNRLIDLHAHPSLKMFLLPYLGYTFHAFTYTGNHWNPLGFRYKYHNVKRSPVKILFNTHYIVEEGFLRHGLKPQARALFTAAAPWSFRRVLKASTAPWESLLRQMDGLERSIRNTNLLVFGDNPRLRLISSAAEIDSLDEREIAVVHAVEGAHVFGYRVEGENPEAFWEQTRQRLHHLRDRGVAALTLAHFWDQPFAPQTDATETVPKKKNGKVVAGRDDLLAEMKRADWRWGERYGLGEKLVREMFEIGIVCDLAHLQEHARWAVYDLAEEYHRPVLISHVGVKKWHDHEYNAGEDEIRRLHELGGVLGLIISGRLLLDPVRRHRSDNIGIPLLVEIMEYIRELTGDVSCIGIGSDFDGLTHPFRDCANPAHLSRLAQAMSRRFSDAEVDDILYGNARRVLKAGWGPRPAPVASEQKPARPKKKKA